MYSLQNILLYEANNGYNRLMKWTQEHDDWPGRSPKWAWQHDDWPRFEYDHTKAYALSTVDFQLASRQLHGNIEALSASDRVETLTNLMLSEVLNTNLIEGEILNRDSVRSSLLVLLSGEAAGTDHHQDEKSLWAAEFMVDVRNHWNSPLDAALLGRWQSYIIAEQRTSNIRRGAFRNDPSPMRIVSGSGGRLKVHYEAPPAARVPDEMARFLDWYNATRPTGQADSADALPGLIRAGIAHVWFEKIHPYDDGNGRVGRAIVDHSLSQTLGYPALACFSTAVERSKNAYYRELERVGRGNLNLDAWLGYFTESVRQAQEIAQSAVNFVLDKTRFYDAYQDQMNERQKKMVARVYAEGIDGFKGGINTRKYCRLTKCSRATAFRDLDDMLKRGMLVKRPGLGRNVSYDLVTVDRSIYPPCSPGGAGPVSPR